MRDDSWVMNHQVLPNNALLYRYFVPDVFLGVAGMQDTEQKNRFGEYVKEVEEKFRKALHNADKVARETMSNLVPAETASHLSNCKREFLLAIRTMIDRELETSSKPAPTDDAHRPASTEKAAE